MQAHVQSGGARVDNEKFLEEQLYRSGLNPHPGPAPPHDTAGGNPIGTTGNSFFLATISLCGGWSSGLFMFEK